MVFYSGNRNPKTDTRPWNIAVTYLTMCFGEDYGRSLELWAGKTSKCSELRGPFSGSFKNKRTKRNTVGGDLDWEAPESFKDWEV